MTCAEPPPPHSADCTPTHSSNLFIKFEDDTFEVGFTVMRRLQEQGKQHGYVGQQSTSEHGEDKRDCGLQENTQSMLLWPSMVLLWRCWAAISSWVCSLLRTSHEVKTPHYCQTKLLILLQNERSHSLPPHHVLLLQGSHREQPDQLHHCVVRSLHSIQLQKPQAHSDCSWENHQHVSALPQEQIQHFTAPQSSQHCEQSHPSITKPAQSAAIRGDTGVLGPGPANSFIQLSGSWTLFLFCPSSIFYFLQTGTIDIFQSSITKDV